MLYTMLVVAYCVGLRVGEIVRLKVGDIDIADQTIEIRETKFFKSRRLPVTNTVRAALDDYLNRAIRHADHTGNTRYRTNFEDIILPCLLDLGGFLRNQHNQPITAHDIIDQANRTLLAYTQRLHCKRIDNRVLERQNRQHIGYI